MSLSAKTCTPCKGGTPPMGRAEAERWLGDVPGWDLTHEATRIERGFRFKNFREALDFTNIIGELAERENHHPEIELGWGHVEVALWTHKINGLHENDFILAAKVSEAAV